ncbi:MAG: hypothetical protein AB8G05_27170 [Oligoflexales bacterium]
MIAAWQFWSINDFASEYTGFISSQKVLHSYKTNLHAAGLFKTYNKNKESNNIIEVEVSGMQRSGYMCNNSFLTKVDFDSEIVDENLYFEASSMFANANLISEKVKYLGGNSWYSAQLLLFLGPESPAFNMIGNTRSQDKLHTIEIPRRFSFGNGFLENLRTDSDVLFHEYGHYMVYKTLKDTSDGEVFAIHDGFADFIAYMMNGDNCLGESLCENTNGCSVRTCLRTGNNEIHLRELPEFIAPGQHYKHSELISGMLWDIHEESELSFDDGLFWIYNTIEYLEHSGNFDNMIKAIIESDIDLFQGENSCAIFNQASKRGFSVPSLESIATNCR